MPSGYVKAPGASWAGAKLPPMRLIVAIWTLILVGGIVFYSIVGLTHS